jgi:hypothetical protein
MPKQAHASMTVGGLKAVMANLPDDAPIFPDWAYGPPGDDMPVVEVCRFAVGKGDRTADGRPYLSVLVDVIPLDEVEGEEEE